MTEAEYEKLESDTYKDFLSLIKKGVPMDRAAREAAEKQTKFPSALFSMRLLQMYEKKGKK